MYCRARPKIGLALRRKWSGGVGAGLEALSGTGFTEARLPGKSCTAHPGPPIGRGPLLHRRRARRPESPAAVREFTRCNADCGVSAARTDDAGISGSLTFCIQLVEHLYQGVNHLHRGIELHFIDADSGFVAAEPMLLGRGRSRKRR